jgi:ubiquinone/menaquinone biosynthesis C-methylase UbiE
MNNITSSVIDIYDTISDSYANQYRDDLSERPHIDTFLEKLPPKSKILDAGCGPGQTVSYIAKKGFQVIGIDFSNKMLSIAKKNYPNCVFRLMDMQHIEFPQDTFNGILSSYSLIHIPDVNIYKVLSSFYRILKKDSWLAIFGQEGKSDHFVDEPFAPGKKTFFNFFTPKRIETSLRDAGFSFITIEKEYCNDPYNISDTNLYILAKK